MMDKQLQSLVDSLDRLSECLALEDRYVDGAVVAGAIQAIRALRTKLEQPETKPALAVVPPEAEAG